MKKLRDLQKEFKDEVINIVPLNGTEVDEEKKKELLKRGVVGNKAVAPGLFFVQSGSYFEVPANEGRVSTRLIFGLVELNADGDKVDTSTISKKMLTSSRPSIIEAGLLGKTDEDLIEALEGHVIEIVSREQSKDSDGNPVLDRYQNPVEVITWKIVE